MSLFKKIKDKLFSGDQTFNSNKGYSSQDLVKLMEKIFIDIMRRKSVDDELIFDCYYIVETPMAFYDEIEVNTDRIIQAIVKRFYKVIENNKDGKNYIPRAKEWDIHFVAKEIENADDLPLEEFFTIRSFPVWLDLSQKSNLDTSYSINGKHSSFSDFDLNQLTDVTMKTKGRGTLRFNPDLQVKTSDHTPEKKTNNLPKQNQGRQLAKIKFVENYTQREVLMKRNMLTIGRGTFDDQSTLSHLYIATDDRGLKENHITIKYVPEERGFYVAVTSSAKLNESNILVSTNTMDMQWVPLRKKSEILCGFTSIKFEAL